MLTYGHMVPSSIADSAFLQPILSMISKRAMHLRNKPYVISFTFNPDELHEEYEGVAQALKDKGFERVLIDLSELMQADDTKTALLEILKDKEIAIDQVALMDFREARRWTLRWDFMDNFLEQLEVLQQEQHQGFAITHSPDTFRFLYDKSHYLTELADSGIPCIETKIVPSDEIFSIENHIAQHSHDAFIVKMATTSRSKGIYKIESEGNNTWRIIKPEADAPKSCFVDGLAPIDTYHLKGQGALNQFFIEQRNQYPDQNILVQPFINAKEYSAVKTGKCWHVVEKIPGEGVDNFVNHPVFGCTSAAVPADQSWAHQTFGKKVLDAFPDGLGSEPFYRVDFFMPHEGDKKPILLEIEGGTMRLMRGKESATDVANLLAEKATTVVQHNIQPTQENQRARR